MNFVLICDDMPWHKYCSGKFADRNSEYAGPQSRGGEEREGEGDRICQVVYSDLDHRK